MKSFRVLPLSARVAGAVVALVVSLSTLSAVVLGFASASGDLEPLVAKSKPAAAASAVASKAPQKLVRG